MFHQSRFNDDFSMGKWTHQDRKLLGFFFFFCIRVFSNLILISHIFYNTDTTLCHLVCTSKHFEISRKAVSATRNYQCTWSVRVDVRMNTLIIVIMTGTSISPLQYVGCINVSGTGCACIKRAAQRIK